MYGGPPRSPRTRVLADAPPTWYSKRVRQGNHILYQLLLRKIITFLLTICHRVLFQDIGSSLGTVQMHVTVPQHQQGPALSSFASLRISLLIATDPSLRSG